MNQTTSLVPARPDPVNPVECRETRLRLIRRIRISGAIKILIAAVLGLSISAHAQTETVDSSAFRNFPPPSTISKEAQEFLASPPKDNIATTVPLTAEAWKEFQAEQNRLFAAPIDAAARERGLVIEKKALAGRTVYVVTPKNLLENKKGKILLHAHGGAYVLNAGKAGLYEAILVAANSGYQLYSVDYRMPPDHPFPAAVDDMVVVYSELLNQHAAKEIAIFGTSAGGSLAAATTLAIRDKKLAMPAAVAMNTPWSDLEKNGDSYVLNEGVDPILVTYDGALAAAAKLYAGGEDLKNPLLSPINADYSKGFPPTLLSSGTRDLFLSNTVRLHRKLRAAGLESELHVFEGMWHGFMYVPETSALMKEFGLFFDKHLLGTGR